MGLIQSEANIVLGSDSNAKQAMVGIPAGPAGEDPGLLVLETVDATAATYSQVYLWGDSAGKLRYDTSIPTNENVNGTLIGAAGATAALDNLASVQIPNAGDLIPLTNNQVTLGDATHGFSTAYLSTSLVFYESTNSLTIGCNDQGTGAVAVTIPDNSGTSLTSFMMLDTASLNSIAYANGTASIAIGAAGSIDVAAAKDVDINMDLTVNTADVTLNQSLQTTDDPTFAALTVTSVTDGTATLTAGAISGLTTVATTSHVSLGADNAELRLGAGGAGDSYLKFDGSTLIFYDTTCGPYTLAEIATGTGLNPLVIGDLTISDGQFNWTDATDETAATWTFANTGANSDIDIVSSCTTGECVHITADACSSGSILRLQSVDATMTSGEYLECHDGGAVDFAIKRYGEVEIAGNDATDIITITKGHVQIDDGKIECDVDSDLGSYFKRSQATATSAIVTVENSDTGTASTGPALDINQLGTGNANGIQLTHNGDYSAIKIDASAASTGDVIEITMANRLAERAFHVSGAATSASSQGLVHLETTGIMAGNALLINSAAANTGSLIHVLHHTTQIGAMGATTGLCAHFEDTAAAAGSAPVYNVVISSTSNEALLVETGIAKFNDEADFAGGLEVADTKLITVGAGNEFILKNSGTQGHIVVATSALTIGDTTPTNYSSFSTAGVLAFAGTARPTQHIILGPQDFVPGSGAAEALLPTSKIACWAFDGATDEYICANFMVPEDYTAGTDMTAYLYWTTSDANGLIVKWDVEHIALVENEDADSASWINDTVTDTASSSTAYDVHKSGAITIASGTAVAGDLVALRVYRDADAVGDTLNSIDALFLCLDINYTADHV